MVLRSLLLASSLAMPMPLRAEPPEVIYSNAVIHTMDEACPRASALAVRDGRIVAVGDAELLQALGPAVQVVDMGGKVILPGLIDAHGHVAALGGFGLGRLDLHEARSFDDVLAILGERVKTAAKGAWILGGRWDHESWPDRKLPTHEKLSALTPDNPVLLHRVDGHAAIANAAALRLAGITRETPAPAGGEIIKDADGEPTGVLIDNAIDLIRTSAAAVSTADLILKAQEMCLAAGLTGVHDAGISPADVEVYRELEKSGRLKLRIYAMIAGEHAKAWFRAHKPLVGERFSLRACKLYADGAMGSRGAWLLEPYSDRPTAEGHPYTGLAVMSPAFIREVTRAALLSGYQVCTHAIGDRGNRETLEAYANAATDAIVAHREKTQDVRAPLDPRAPFPRAFRIEHAQLLSPQDIPRFAGLGVIASMQPTHCTTDMRWLEARVGPERAQGAYAWATLAKAGVKLAFGSDFPVESQNPFLGIYAAVTRQDAAGRPEGGWHAEEKLTREQALRAFTLDAAYAAYEETSKGSLAPGKLADFIVIDRDIMDCPPREILETKVLRTFVGGEEVYSQSP